MNRRLRNPLGFLTSSLQQLSTDPVNRGWVLVFAGSVARLALGLVASVVIARALGPADFGVYAVLAAAVGIAGAIADLGLTDAAVKRIAAAWQPDPTAARERGRVFFALKVGAAGLLAGAGILLAGPLSRRVLDLPGDGLLLRLALLGIVATATSGAVSAMLQATGRFSRLSVVLIVNSGLTALLAAGLAVAGHLTLVTALVVLGIGTSLVSFATGRRLLPGEWPLRVPDQDALKDEGRRLIRFGRWLWVANMFAMLTAQLDVLLVNRWSVPATVGAYALALNLASKVDVVNHSLYTVLLPRASALDGEGAFGRYVRRGLVRSGLISLALLPLFPLAGPLIALLYGPAYALAVRLFRLLLGMVVFDVFTTPVLLLAFPLDQSKLLAAADALRAGTLALAGAWLIPTQGPAGAVAAKFGARVAGAVLVLAVLRLQLPRVWASD